MIPPLSLVNSPLRPSFQPRKDEWHLVVNCCDLSQRQARPVPTAVVAPAGSDPLARILLLLLP